MNVVRRRCAAAERGLSAAAEQRQEELQVRDEEQLEMNCHHSCRRDYASIITFLMQFTFYRFTMKKGEEEVKENGKGYGFLLYVPYRAFLVSIITLTLDR